MTNNIKVSVLVPVYGVEKFIERCVRSIFEQTMTEGVEYIFVNDCTKDRSIEILERVIEDYPHIKPFVKIIHHETNKGLAATRNTSIDHATGEYICMVDSDDYADVNMIKVLYNKAIETDADIVSSKIFLDYKNSIKKEKIKKRNSKEEYFKDILIKSHFWRRIYRRSLFEEHKIRVQEHLTNGFLEDFSIVPILYYYAKKICFIDECLYHYVQYNTQSYTKNITLEDINTNIRIINSHDDFFRDKEQVYIDAMEFIKIWFITYSSFFIWDIPVQKKIFNTFKGVDYNKHYSELPLKIKMIYILAKRNLFWLLNIVFCIYYTVIYIRRNTQLYRKTRCLIKNNIF